MSGSNARPKKEFPWKAIIGGLVLVACAVAAYVFDARSKLKAVLDGIEQLGIWGPVLFIGIYIAATVFMVPGSVLTLGAGAVFGVAWGSIYVSVGATLGATTAFLVGRYLARDWVKRKVEGSERFAAIDKAVEREGWKIVGLTRLSPVFPFNLLNYAFGLTKVRFWHYVGASWIGMMPGTVLYVYLGSIAKAATVSGERSPGEWALYGVGLVATIAVTVYVTRIAKKALANKADLPEGTRA